MMVVYDILAKYFHQLLTIKSYISSMLVLNEKDETYYSMFIDLSKLRVGLGDIF